MKQHLNISIEEWVGAKLDWDSAKEQLILTGPMKEVLEILIKDDFTYTLIRAPDKEWGTFENNSWSGVMGLLDRNVSDLALGPIGLTYHRSQVSPYTSQLFSDEMSILSTYTHSDVDIFKPLFHFLNHYSWLLVFIFVLIFSFVTTLSNTFRLNNSSFKLKTNNKLTSIEIMANHLWTFIAILLLRGNGLTQTDISTINRCLIILISMSSLFLTTMLSALIGMSIITGPEKGNIDSLEELLEQDVMPVLLGGSYQQDLFLHNSVAVYQKVWKKLNNNIVSLKSMSDDMLINKIIQRRTVIIDGIMHLNGFAANICGKNPNSKLYFGSDTFLPTQFVLMTSKRFFEINPEFHKYVNHVVLNLVSSGIFNEKMKGVLNKSMNCKVCKQDYSNVIFNIKAFPFKLIEVKKMLFVFISLNFIEIFIFFIELKFFEILNIRNKYKDRTLPKESMDSTEIIIPKDISNEKGCTESENERSEKELGQPKTPLSEIKSKDKSQNNLPKSQILHIPF